MSDFEVVSSVERHSGAVITVRTDTVRMPGGDTADRDVVAHPGAVGVVALDESDRVLLIRQYRHPLRRALWELPAGLRDAEGEPAVDTARRELREETGCVAGSWFHLAEYDSSPGMTDEHAIVFLARSVTDDPGGRPEGEHEESGIEIRWLPLDEAVAWVLDGRITNAMAVIGLLAAARARDGGYASLRPAS